MNFAKYTIATAVVLSLAAGLSDASSIRAKKLRQGE